MNWKEYFNNIAHAVALKSKDPSSKVGCVIVDQDNRIISQGFNGFVAGCDESKMSWERPMKYNLVIHAEANALLFAREPLKGAKAYVTHGPCDNCLKHMLQAGIREIYYKDPSIMRDRSSSDQKEAIGRLIEGTGAKVENVETGKSYKDELIKEHEVTVEFAPFRGLFIIFSENKTLGSFSMEENDFITITNIEDAVADKATKTLKELFPEEKFIITIKM